MKRTLIICTLCLFGLITNAQDLSIEKIFSYTLKDYSSIENYFITNGYDFIKLDTSSEALNLYWSELHYSSGKSFDDTTIDIISN